VSEVWSKYVCVSARACVCVVVEALLTLGVVCVMLSMYLLGVCAHAFTLGGSGKRLWSLALAPDPKWGLKNGTQNNGEKLPIDHTFESNPDQGLAYTILQAIRA